jgi:hypothetical protein
VDYRLTEVSNLVRENRLQDAETVLRETSELFPDSLRLKRLLKGETA